MKHFHQKNLITALILSGISGISSLAYANPVIDSGLLQKEVDQTQQLTKVKPSGELFKAEKESQAPSTKEQYIKLRLNAIKLVGIDGNEIQENLDHLISPYLNRELTLADLNQLSQQITAHFRNNDYLVARAFIPPQEIHHNTLQIMIIKGSLDQVSIKNGSHLKDNLIKRIADTTVNSSPFIIKNRLEQLALLLNDIKGITSSLSLKAGKNVGSSDLIIHLKDTQRWAGYIYVDNQGNKNTGKYRTTLGNKIYNMIGLGDELNIDFLSSHTFDLYNLRTDYSFIIDGYGTRFGVNANYLKYKLGSHFKDLNAQGNTYNLGAYILNPTIRSANLRLDTKVAFNHQKLSDQQKAADLKQKRQVNTVSVGLLGSWNSVKNGVSYFSLFTHFGKESHLTNEKAHYLSDNYQAKRTFTTFNYSLSHEQFLPKSFSANFSINGQFADKNLDSANKFLLGGLAGVKGYQSGIVSVDEGHIVQTELKHYLPVFDQSMLISTLFYNYGFGKQYKNTEILSEAVENNVKLQSLGAGLNLMAPNNYSLNIIYAKPIGKKYNNADKHQIWLSAIKAF